jgi:hypothetical protein
METQNATLSRALEALASVCTEPTAPHPIEAPKYTAGRQYAWPEPPPHDPAAWREPVAEWLDVACVRHWRCHSSVTSLHRAYTEWELSHEDAPCRRETFELLLRELGFLIVDKLVSGLILREDLNGLRVYPHINRLFC